MFNQATATGLLNALATKAKAFAAGVTEIELKVLEATNEDKWGPHGNDMKEIARAAEHPEDRALIMNTIWLRLRERDENWRLCYKAMLLCEYLIKQGPMRCVDELQKGAYVFERLRDNFHYKDQDGRDQGINVRQRARELAALLSSNQKIQEEREKARINAGKYTGVSAADMRSGGSYGSGGGGGGRQYVGFGSDSYQTHHNHSYSDGNNNNTNSYSSSSGYGAAAGGGGGGGSGGHSRTHSGQGGRAAGGTEEDPFEATRRRIERLKAQEKAADAHDVAAVEGDGHVPAGSIDMDAVPKLFPDAKPRMGPKKLSEVKVDPAIAAAFGGGLAPPPGAGSVVKSSVTKPPAATNSSPADIFGDDFAAAPAAPQPAPPAAAAVAATASRLDDLLLSSPPSQPPTSAAAAPADPFAFGAVSSAPAAKPAAGSMAGGMAGAGVVRGPTKPNNGPFPDPFAVLTPAPAAKPAAQPQPAAAAAAKAADDFFSDPFGAPQAAASSAAAASKPAAAQSDPFGDPFGDFSGAPAAKPAAAAGISADPFAVNASSGSTTAGDSFGAFAAAPSAAGGPVGGFKPSVAPPMKAGAAPAAKPKSSDPFADLLS